MKKYLALLLVFGALSAVPAKPSAADEASAGPVCVMDIEGVAIGPLPSPVHSLGCFPSLRAAPLGSRTVISIDWDGPNYTGAALVWTVAGEDVCLPGLEYRVNEMPVGWDDRVASSQSFGGCRTNEHYEHENWQGARELCPCRTMTAMNYETSSEKWSA